MLDLVARTILTMGIWIGLPFIFRLYDTFGFVANAVALAPSGASARTIVIAVFLLGAFVLTYLVWAYETSKGS